MRIGTWNVDYARGSRNSDRLSLLESKDADIWVLTETHSDLDLSKTHVALMSEERPKWENPKVCDGSTWVTIWSRFPVVSTIKVPDARRMVAAVFDTSVGLLALAGVVLPWNSDIGDKPGEQKPAPWEEHKRVLRDQMKVLMTTMSAESGGCRRAIAGDFNSHQAFPYPFPYPYPHDESLRRELAALLSDGFFTCHTADEEVPGPLQPGGLRQKLIDHVCSDFGPAFRVETWSGIDGKSPRLSDHAGVFVDLPD